MMKKTLAVSFVLVIILTVLHADVYARYNYTSSVSSALTISGKTAYCNSRATGMSMVTKIAGVQYLQKKGLFGLWSTVENGTWTKTVNTNLIEMNNNQKSNLESGTYRVRTVFTVYSGNNSEEVEKISSEATVQ
ncbi:MAG: hypothetical protein LBS21_15865 [Clostridiales bacterium]|jgi:hypothetical protein|nr:hypothetical protein [Clostridiales bacterium]